MKVNTMAFGRENLCPYARGPRNRTCLGDRHHALAVVLVALNNRVPVLGISALPDASVRCLMC